EQQQEGADGDGDAEADSADPEGLEQGDLVCLDEAGEPELGASADIEGGDEEEGAEGECRPVLGEAAAPGSAVGCAIDVVEGAFDLDDHAECGVDEDDDADGADGAELEPAEVINEAGDPLVDAGGLFGFGGGFELLVGEGGAGIG